MLNHSVVMIIRLTFQEAFTLQGVAAKRVVEGEDTEDCYISGKLSLVEKVRVFPPIHLTVTFQTKNKNFLLLV